MRDETEKAGSPEPEVGADEARAMAETIAGMAEILKGHQPESRFGPGTQALIDLARKAAGLKTISGAAHDGSPVDAVILKDGAGGQRVYDLGPIRDARALAPRRIEGAVTLRDVGSFNAYVTRFDENTDCAMFAEEEPGTVTCVLDYHVDASTPRACKHVATLALEYAREWKRWNAAAGTWMPQQEFADFLEDNIVDLGPVPTPDNIKASETLADLVDKMGAQFASPAMLVEMARGLKINVEQRVTSTAMTNGGESEIVFEERHTGERGERVKVPPLFMIAVRVFNGGAYYKLPVRLQYRARGGGIRWQLSVYRPDKAREHAFAEILESIRAETGADIFAGAATGASAGAGD